MSNTKKVTTTPRPNHRGLTSVIMKTTILLLLTAFVSGSASILLVRAIGSSPDFWVNFLQIIGFILTLAISGASLNKLEKWIGRN